MHALSSISLLFAGALALASAQSAPPAGTYGTVTVTNDCAFPVYIAHADQNGVFGNNAYAPGAVYSEPMYFQGVSLKFTTDGNIYGGDENELGYSWVDGTALYWTWGQNGAPFAGNGGFEVLPDVTNQNCYSLQCEAGDASCDGVSDTRGCPLTTNLQVNLCSAA